jgi:hypothetical protein
MNGYRADPKRTDDGASESPARRRCPHERLRRNTTSREAGFLTVDMRAQAVPPMVMAPTTANASRHHSEGTQIWANARVTSRHVGGCRLARNDRGAAGSELRPPPSRIPGTGCGSVWKKALTELSACVPFAPRVHQNQLADPERALVDLDHVLCNTSPRAVPLTLSGRLLSDFEEREISRGLACPLMSFA